MRDLPVYERMAADVAKRRDNGLFRTVATAFNGASDCSTNSYLCLEQITEIRQEAARLCEETFSGSRASRLISDGSPLFDGLETELASWKKSESALVFNSGYVANLGVLQAICTRHTEVFSDRFNHASIVDGIALSGAQCSRYAHCDMADLEKRLAASTAKEKLIITDTVFSMDGDVAPLADICDLAQKYRCMLMIDEAHATGMFGKTGSGIAESMDVADVVDISIGTLSKAIAGAGGFFAGTALIRDFLVNHSRGFIYSTALPHATLAWNLAAVRYIRANPGTGGQVLANAVELRKGLNRLGYSTLNSSTQIVPVVIGNSVSAVEYAQRLRQAGIKIPAIRPPTVPEGTARLRISVNRLFDAPLMKKILDTLSDRSTANG